MPNIYYVYDDDEILGEAYQVSELSGGELNASSVLPLLCMN